MPANFYELIGPGGKPEGRRVFELLVLQLLRLDHPAIGADDSSGDWGMDAVVWADEAHASIWQAKFFIDGFGSGRHSQVRASFGAALHAAEARGFTIDSWTLCVPVEPEAQTSRWWTAWSQRTTQSTGVSLALLTASGLEQLLLQPKAREVARHYFPKSLGTVHDLTSYACRG